MAVLFIRSHSCRRIFTCCFLFRKAQRNKKLVKRVVVNNIQKSESRIHGKVGLTKVSKFFCPVFFLNPNSSIHIGIVMVDYICQNFGEFLSRNLPYNLNYNSKTRRFLRFRRLVQNICVQKIQKQNSTM